MDNSTQKKPNSSLDSLCLIINLRKEKTRFTEISSSLSRLDINFERYDAIHGTRFSNSVRSIFNDSFSPEKNRELTLGEMSCTLSHIGALRKALRTSCKHIIILEDDASFNESFKPILDNHIPQLLQMYGIVKLEGIFRPWSSLTGPGVNIYPFGKAVTPLRPTLGTAAYATSRQGAKEILLYLENNKSDPFDHLITEYERHNIRYAELRPFPVFQSDANESTINDERNHAEANYYKQPSYSFIKQLNRYTAKTTRLLIWMRELLADLMRFYKN